MHFLCALLNEDLLAVRRACASLGLGVCFDSLLRERCV